MGCRSPHGIHQQPIILLLLRGLFAVLMWHFRSCFVFRKVKFSFSRSLFSRILYRWVGDGPNKTSARGVVRPVFAQDIERGLESRERSELSRLTGYFYGKYSTNSLGGWKVRYKHPGTDRYDYS